MFHEIHKNARDYLGSDCSAGNIDHVISAEIETGLIKTHQPLKRFYGSSFTQAA